MSDDVLTRLREEADYGEDELDRLAADEIERLRALLVRARLDRDALLALLAEVKRYLDDPSAPEWEEEGVYNTLLAKIDEVVPR